LMGTGSGGWRRNKSGAPDSELAGKTMPFTAIPLAVT